MRSGETVGTIAAESPVASVFNALDMAISRRFLNVRGKADAIDSGSDLFGTLPGLTRKSSSPSSPPQNLPLRP
jgi:hypothetical protein